MKFIGGVFALALVCLALKASTVEPEKPGVCVPLYSETGMECCKSIGGNNGD